VKPGFEQPIDSSVFKKTTYFFEELMHLLHPFMPFITEEIYHKISERTDDLCTKTESNLTSVLPAFLSQGELLKKIITNLRDARNKNQIKPKDTIVLHIQTSLQEQYQAIQNILSKQVNAKNILFTNTSIANTIVVAVEKDKFYIESEVKLDTGTLKDELLKDLEHQKNFLQSVIKKLSNERFVQNAKPEVVAMEEKKKADAEARIKTIEESLSSI
jgi:valyl-tRNA synthetase